MLFEIYTWITTFIIVCIVWLLLVGAVQTILSSGLGGISHSLFHEHLWRTVVLTAFNVYVCRANIRYVGRLLSRKRDKTTFFPIKKEHVVLAIMNLPLVFMIVAPLAFAR